MSFGNIAGRAGFVLDLDKSALDRGLPQAERQFESFTRRVADSAAGVREAARREFDDLDEYVRVRSRRASSIGPLRLAGVGLGAGTTLFAATQAVRELSDALDVTGEKAFTAEGRVRNFGSSLLRGDLIGGIKELGRTPETFEDLGLAAGEAEGALDGLAQAADVFGGKWRTVYEEARLVASSYREIAAAAREVLTASVGFRSPSGQLLAGGFDTRPQMFPQGTLGQRLRGAGFTPTEGVPTPIGPTARNRAAQTVAQASGDLQELLRLQIVERERLEKAVRNSHGNVQQREALNQQLASATASVASTQRQIEQNQKAEAASAAAAAASREAEQARALREGISTREQLLRNQYEQATGTPGLRDDRRRASSLSAFLGARSRDPRLDAGERADFRSRQIAFLAERRRDREALAKAALDDTREELRLQEQVLQNNVKAAELTEKNKQDDVRALRRLRDFYRRQEREADTRAERQDFRGDRIATQKKLNEMLGKDGDKPVTLADIRRLHVVFLTGLQGMTNQFGSNVTADGAQTATNTWQTSRLMAEQNRLLDRLARGVQHPGARYARNELMLAYGGVGGI